MPLINHSANPRVIPSRSLIEQTTRGACGPELKLLKTILPEPRPYLKETG